MAISPSFTNARAFNGPSQTWAIYASQNAPGTTLYMAGSDSSSFNTSWPSWYPGTSNFCIESWVYFTNTAGSGIGTLWTLGGLNQAINADLGLAIIAGGTSQYQLAGSLQGITNGVYGTMFNGGVDPLNSAWVIPNTWTHVAMSRSSGTVNLWVNGVLAATTTYGTNMTNPSATNATIGMFGRNGLSRYNQDDAGYNLVGYTRNTRYVTGNAVYTSTFTPPPLPCFLPVITGTYFKIEPMANSGDFSADPTVGYGTYPFVNEINAPSFNYSISPDSYSQTGDQSTYGCGLSLLP